MHDCVIKLFFSWLRKGGTGLMAEIIVFRHGQLPKPPGGRSMGRRLRFRSRHRHWRVKTYVFLFFLLACSHDRVRRAAALFLFAFAFTQSLLRGACDDLLIWPAISASVAIATHLQACICDFAFSDYGPFQCQIYSKIRIAEMPFLDFREIQSDVPSKL